MNLAVGANSKQQTEQTFSIAIPIRLFWLATGTPTERHRTQKNHIHQHDILAEDEPADVIPYYSYTRAIPTEWTCFTCEKAHTRARTLDAATESYQKI